MIMVMNVLKHTQRNEINLADKKTKHIVISTASMDTEKPSAISINLKFRPGSDFESLSVSTAFQLN